MKRCVNYVGIFCVNGLCPKANYDEYKETNIPLKQFCKHCLYYKGCEDCCFYGTDMCIKED